MAQNYSALGVDVPAPPQEDGLAFIADRLADARKRVASVVSTIHHISNRIHGPRPSAVSAGENASAQIRPDSLRSRLDDLISEVGELEAAIQTIMR